MENLQTLIDLGNWQRLEELLDANFATNQGDDFFYIECIYLLQSSLLNGTSLPTTEFERVHRLLKKVFEKSYVRFGDNPNYLFFVGYFIALCDWCFGLDGLSLSHEMLRRAKDLDSMNPLFRWGYSFSTEQSDAKKLSLELSQNESVLISIASKGLAGQYIADTIREMPYYLDLPKG